MKKVVAMLVVVLFLIVAFGVTAFWAIHSNNSPATPPIRSLADDAASTYYLTYSGEYGSY